MLHNEFVIQGVSRYPVAMGKVYILPEKRAWLELHHDYHEERDRHALSSVICASVSQVHSLKFRCKIVS